MEKELMNIQLRKLVRDYFTARQKQNPKYSLRALAMHLNVNQSFLSKFLREERTFSKKMVYRLGENMGFSPSQLASTIGQNGTSNLESLTLKDDEFLLISDWIHFAILEALKIPEIQKSPMIMAQHFGVHVEQIRGALDRLVRLNILSKVPKNFDSENKTEIEYKIIKSQLNWVNHDKTTSAKTQLQKQLNEKSKEALENIEFSLRYHGSVTLALDTDQLDDFKKRLAALVDEFAKDTHQKSIENLNQIYQITFSMFPLSKQKIPRPQKQILKTKDEKPCLEELDTI